MPPNVVLGNNVTLFCNAKLRVMNTCCEMIEFEYGFSQNSRTAFAGLNQTNTFVISPVTLSSAGNYSCTVNVTANDVGSGEALGSDLISSNDSNVVSLSVQCELCFQLRSACLSLFMTNSSSPVYVIKGNCSS